MEAYIPSTYSHFKALCRPLTKSVMASQSTFIPLRISKPKPPERRSPSRTPGIYDTTIPDESTDDLRATKEAVNKAVRSNYGLFEAGERGTREFILEVVEDTYIHDLKSSRFF